MYIKKNPPCEVCMSQGVSNLHLRSSCHCLSNTEFLLVSLTIADWTVAFFLILIEEPKLLLQLKLSFTASLSGTKTWASSVLFSFYVNAGHKPWIFRFPVLSTSTRLQLGLFFPTCSITAFPTFAMFHAWYSLADTGTSRTLAFLGFARSLTPRFEITSTSAPLHFTCFFLVGGCFIRIICFYGERSDKCVSA